MDPYQELYHFGVKGMKWGVRKKRDTSVFETRGQARRQARKDAKEWRAVQNVYKARGKDAAKRRKEITKAYQERSKDADYKKAFKRSQQLAMVGKAYALELAGLATAAAIVATPYAVAYGSKAASKAIKDLSAKIDPYNVANDVINLKPRHYKVY